MVSEEKVKEVLGHIKQFVLMSVAVFAGVVILSLMGSNAIQLQCSNGILDGNESGVDCGGFCDPCSTCSDGIANQNESGVDCGGPCSSCPTCDDGIQNQGEDGVDCGAPCDPCVYCSDRVRNYGEDGVDCGGPCSPCPIACGTNGDCGGLTIYSKPFCHQGDVARNVTVYVCINPGSIESTCINQTKTVVVDECSSGERCVDGDMYCRELSCSDGIMNQGEDGVDCGGPCNSCPSCSDGVKNQGETGVDCGGPCMGCPECYSDSDCGSESYGPYVCSGKRIMRAYYTHSCVNGVCRHKSDTVLVHTCKENEYCLPGRSTCLERG